MSLLSMLLQRKRPEAPFDPKPEEIDYVPVRPYRVIYADLPFYSDPECKMEVKDARLVVLRCEDRRQKHETIECMPTLKNYKPGQLLLWEINPRKQWEAAWYADPATGEKAKAWVLAAEFLGKVVTARASTAH